MMNKKNFLPKLYPLNRDMEKTWFVQYRDHTGRILKSYGQLNHLFTLKGRLREADRIIHELTAPARAHRRQRSDLIYNLTAVLEYKQPGLAHRSYTSYFSILRLFADWYRSESAKRKDISPGEYIRYLQVEGAHNNHIRKIMIVLASWFKVLVKQGKFPFNPFADIRVKKVKSQSLLPFSANQVATLKEAMQGKDPQLWEACLHQYYLFFRPAEIRLLRIEHIIFDEMVYSVGADLTKDDDVLLKPVPLPMQPLVESYRGYPGKWFIFGKNGAPGPQCLSINNLNKRHRGFLDRADISHRYGFYSWIHTGIKNAAMARIPLPQLQLQKGHSDLKMFAEYLKNIGVKDCLEMVNEFPGI
ncbi:MAG: hypothetical protein Q8L07_04705 [Sediminibacterium sp.]|nr:hypothetical protein [Sediminibacterium sp.]